MVEITTENGFFQVVRCMWIGVLKVSVEWANWGHPGIKMHEGDAVAEATTELYLQERYVFS